MCIKFPNNIPFFFYTFRVIPQIHKIIIFWREQSHFLHKTGIRTAVELAIKAMHIPTDILIKLSRFYNTSIDYLLDQTDVKEPYARRVEK